MTKSVRAQYEYLKSIYDSRPLNEFPVFFSASEYKNNHVDFVYFAACDQDAVLFLCFLSNFISSEEKTAALLKAIENQNPIAICLLLESQAVLSNQELEAACVNLIEKRAVKILQCLVRFLPAHQSALVASTVKQNYFAKFTVDMSEIELPSLIFLLRCGVKASNIYTALSHKKFKAAAWLLVYGATCGKNELDLITPENKRVITAEIVKIAEEALSSQDDDLRNRCLKFFTAIGMERPIPDSELSRFFYAHTSRVGWAASSIWATQSLIHFRKLNAALSQAWPDFEPNDLVDFYREELRGVQQNLEAAGRRKAFVPG